MADYYSMLGGMIVIAAHFFVVGALVDAIMPEASKLGRFVMFSSSVFMAGCVAGRAVFYFAVLGGVVL